MSSNTKQQQLVKLSQELTKNAKDEAKHIRYESFGTDKNKKRKNQNGCDRGTNSGVCRYCSPHIRQIYTQEILGDDEKSEFCVNGRNTKHQYINPCGLCNININNFCETRSINFGEALGSALNCNLSNDDTKNKRLLSFMLSYIGKDYPKKNDETTLRITVNGQVWIEYFIKLTAFSSLLKTSAPSGYKYKDRISLGRMIKIQGNTNKDLIFYITKNEHYHDDEKEEQRPVVNCVGFWNLTKPKDGGIRQIIHLNHDQAVNVSFGFLMNPQRIDTIHSIVVELVCTRSALSIKDEVLSLWRYPECDNNSMDTMDGTPTSSSLPPPNDNNCPLPLPPMLPMINNNNNNNNNNHNALPVLQNNQNITNYGPHHNAMHSVQEIRFNPIQQPQAIIDDNNSVFLPMNPAIFDDNYSVLDPMNTMNVSHGYLSVNNQQQRPVPINTMDTMNTSHDYVSYQHQQQHPFNGYYPDNSSVYNGCYNGDDGIFGMDPISTWNN